MNPAMMKQPDDKPAAPTPEIARPMISTVDDGATPHIIAPISNIARAVMKPGLSGKYLKIFPHDDWKPAIVMKKADEYQETSASPYSLVILGSAVATMVYVELLEKPRFGPRMDYLFGLVELLTKSNAIMKILSTKATTIATNRNPFG